MRLRDTIICIFCVLLGLALLTVASSRLDSIRSARQEMGLVSNEPLENAPPSLAFATVAMGAFRGLVVDILWMRADKLKEEGQFFDAKQLADWICVLQPRFSSVWDFQAWNMAYNISVAMPASQWEDRWRWVRNGYELLRDKGIEINPHSIILYRSLAWIFQHKIGGVSDDCHKHYRRELALSIRPLLGDKSNEYFESLIAAPKTFEQIISDPEIAKLINALQAANEEFKKTDDFVKNYLTLRQNPDKFSKDTFRVIDDFRGTKALEKFDVFAKAYELRHTWKLEPEFMHKLNKKYGPVDYDDDPNNHQPLDWEHADSHAIYWAERGLEIAGKPGEYSIDEKNTDRIVFHSLQSLYRQGKQIIYPVQGELPSVFLRPDPRMFDSCSTTWLKIINKYESLEKSNPKAVRNGYRNFLKNAVLTFYQSGHTKKAGQVYLMLRDEFPDREELKIPLSVYVKDRMREEISSLAIYDAVELINSSLVEAYFRYAVRDDDVAASREKYAKDVYDMYQKEFGSEEVRRVDLPSFEMLRYLAFMSFMNDTLYPEQLRKNLFGRIQIERPDLYEKLRQQKDIFIEKVQQAEQEKQKTNQ